MIRGGRAPLGARARTPAPPPGRWIVALPVWGERCLGVFMRATLPALIVALRELGRPAVLLVYGGEGAACASSEMVEVRMLPVPGPDGAFESMSNCHRDALAAAAPGDRVLLLTADMVLSREVLATCEAQFVGGWKRLACCCAMRALDGVDCPVGVGGVELLEWAWANRHPMTRACTWPEGRSYDIWRMYFEQAGEAAARVFLPHPLACIPSGERLRFNPTIDVNLAANFSPAETYMITRPEEGGVVELSPPDKDFLLTTTMRERMDAGGPSCPPLARCTNGRHRMFFGKRVVIRGAGGDCGDGEVVGRVLG